MERYTVNVSREGETITVTMEQGVADGFVGRGADVASALEDLARQLRDEPGKQVGQNESASGKRIRAV